MKQTAEPKSTNTRRGELDLQSTLAVVVGHPLRMRCFHALNERCASPSHLARAFNVSAKLAEFHVLKLVEAGVAEEAWNRPRANGQTERFYRACERPKVDQAGWERMTEEERHAYTIYVLKMHTAETALAVDEGTFDKWMERWLCRLPMTLDAEAMIEMDAEEERSYQRRLEIQAAAAKRNNERAARGEPRDEAPIASVTMFFERAMGRGELGRTLDELGAAPLNGKEPAAE